MILAQSVCARHAEFFPRVRESTCSATTVLLPGLCKSRWHSINYSFGPVLSSFGHGCSMGFLLNWAQQPAARGRQAPRTTHKASVRWSRSSGLIFQYQIPVPESRPRRGESPLGAGYLAVWSCTSRLSPHRFSLKASVLLLQS